MAVTVTHYQIEHPGRERRVLRHAPQRARYDAAQTTDENRRHWIHADHLSALAATREDVRRIIRARARYEVANNSYAKGIVRSLADYIIGTGPRLQVMTSQPGINRLIESRFGAWAAADGLAEKLHVLRTGRAESGECFLRLRTRDQLNTPVKLHLQLIESDQVASPWPHADPRMIDGVRVDDDGEPAAYHVLHRHPGDHLFNMGILFGGDEVPAEQMIHFYRAERPGQIRGVPEITPALPLFAQLRRYTLATVAAAETAANIAGVLETQSPGVVDDDDYAKPLDLVELERNALVALPYDSKLNQLRAEQPATNYAMFKRELISEIARCLGMPYAIAAGDSSEHNYASGRLDFQAFFKFVDIEQVYLERTVLERIFNAWLSEAVLIEDYLPQFLRQRDAFVPHQWFWDGTEHVDPLKEAKAQETRLANHMTTFADEWARQGWDWEPKMRQRAREMELMRELGLPMPGAAAAKETEDDDEEEETTPPRRESRAQDVGRGVAVR